MKAAELFDECEQIVAYEHHYGTSEHFFRAFELSTMVVGEAFYGPFTLKQVQKLLWELSELSNKFSIIHKPQECYGFKVLGFCVELDNGFYILPEIDIDRKRGVEPYQLYSIILNCGSDKDKQKYLASGILDDIGWEYYIS